MELPCLISSTALVIGIWLPHQLHPKLALRSSILTKTPCLLGGPCCMCLAVQTVRTGCRWRVGPKSREALLQPSNFTFQGSFLRRRRPGNLEVISKHVHFCLKEAVGLSHNCPRLRSAMGQCGTYANL